MFTLACNLPEGVAATIKDVYNILLIAIPVVVIVIGLVDLLKAVSAQKEDEIKRNQSIVIKRVVISLIAFIIVGVVKLLLGMVHTGNTSSAVSCIKEIFG